MKLTLTQADYQQALDVQNACNLCGVSRSFNEVMKKLLDSGLSTHEANTHPIAKLWADKIASLTQIQNDPEAIHRAFEICEREAKGPRLFCGVFPEGLSWADRHAEEHGDYKRLAFLSFGTLELEIYKECPPELAEQIRKDAAEVQANKGQQYEVSSSGQTITLGWKLK